MLKTGLNPVGTEGVVGSWPRTSRVSASLEDYLEAIYHTVEAKGAARAKDIVMRMGVHNSSVTQALRSLSEKELVNYAPYDVITLTDAGERIALDVVKRHTTLSAFLNKVLGLPTERGRRGRLPHGARHQRRDPGPPGASSWSTSRPAR